MKQDFKNQPRARRENVTNAISVKRYATSSMTAQTRVNQPKRKRTRPGAQGTAGSRADIAERQATRGGIHSRDSKQVGREPAQIISAEFNLAVQSIPAVGEFEIIPGGIGTEAAADLSKSEITSDSPAHRRHKRARLSTGGHGKGTVSSGVF